jgi:hypothetical protein
MDQSTIHTELTKFDETVESQRPNSPVSQLKMSNRVKKNLPKVDNNSNVDY